MKIFIQKLTLSLVILVTFTSAIIAQNSVSGRVADSEGNGLIGASVLVKGSTDGTITDLDGNFTLNIANLPAVLEFSYTGFETQEREVKGGETLIITLAEASTQLDAVVVTGLASNIKRSNLANNVASIDAKEISGIAVSNTTETALYGKASGTNISASSGAPGGGISMKLRGTTSINGSSQPLFIIDGVFIDNSSIPAGLNVVSRASSGGSASNQDNPSNRLADIDPNDIETIEILKGASAAAIYGNRAAGGVVIITTKKGKSGDTKINFGQSFGWAEMLNPLGVREFTEDRIRNSGRFWLTDQDGNALPDDQQTHLQAFRAAQAAGTIRNYEEELYGNRGMLSNSRLSMSGGNDRTQFFFGSTFKREEGIVRGTGYDKTSVRLNLNHKINDWLDMDLSTNYVNSSADRGFFNNDNSGTTMGISFTSTPSWADLLPDEDGNFPANPYGTSNFLETAEKVTNNEKVNRFIGGAKLTAKLLTTDNSSLKAIVNGGFDSYGLYTLAHFPNTVQFQRDGNGLNGVVVHGNSNVTRRNGSAFLLYTNSLSNGLISRTQAGITYDDYDRNTIYAESFDFVGTGTNVDLGAQINSSQSRVASVNKGFFVQEELNYNDQFIVTVGLRGDKSSLNGNPDSLFFYPKASAAVNIHELVDLPALSNLKLRAAFGQSSKTPEFADKYSNLNQSIIGGLPATTPSSLFGNPNITPERQTEIEFGADFGFMNNRFLLDATYYIKTVDDLILRAQVPTSSGFSTEVTNGAALENRGVELGLSGNIIESDKLNWFARLSWWKNNATVTELSIPSYTTGGFADFLGNFRIKEGHSPTEIIGVIDDPELADEDGLYVYGDAEPDFQMSWFNGLSFGDLELNWLLHWKQGGENINLSALLFDLNETTHDFDDTDLDPSGELTNGNYRLSLLGSSTAPYIQDAGYIRLREIGAYYKLPFTLGDNGKLTVGVSGTNLINIFSYDSYDPEVSNFGSGGLSTGVEVTPFPSSKRVNFHIKANF